MSAAGVFGTADGGESWHPLNKGVRTDFIPDEKDLEFGQCPHKLLGHPAKDGLLYQQNHCGVYRSDDGGQSWEDITPGLPSRFGMPLALHPHDPKTLYVLPEDNAIAEAQQRGNASDRRAGHRGPARGQVAALGVGRRRHMLPGTPSTPRREPEHGGVRAGRCGRAKLLATQAGE